MPFLLPDCPIESLDEYVEHWSGGQGIARADELGPDGVVQVLDASGLRGRGGAGFPTGRKWGSVRAGGPDGLDVYDERQARKQPDWTYRD